MIGRIRLVAGCALAACCATAAHAQSGTASLAPAFDAANLTELPVGSWPTNGGNLYNQRHSPLTQINRDNVASLKGVWRARLDGSGVDTQYSGEAQPIVYDGVLYVITGANDVFAIDIETGERLWKYAAGLDPTNDVICCGWTSRGVGLGDGKVFVGQLDGQLKALDQQTGEVLWATQAERWEEGYSITSAPLYYDGLVVTGFAGAEFGTRGRVKAYDADNGDLVWTFYTIPGPGDIGHDTWPQDNEIWRNGGATVWQTPAVDDELGLMYFSTGNPGPDFNGAVRRGDNLFSASIVAIDAQTGEYRWHFQQVHHDIWDLDGPSPVVLFDIEIDGALRKGLAQASKTGWVYILDRTNGAPLVGIEERPVPQDARQATAPTQPYPIGDSFVPQRIDIAPEGFRLINDGRIFTPYWTTPTVLKPSLLGGANWPPGSFDPATGYLFVCASDDISVFTAEDIADSPPPEGELYTAGSFGTTSIPALGTLTALDMRTNTIAWQQHWAERCYSGAVNTAGGLLFVGRNDGRLTALDSHTGELLWEFQTGAGMNSTVSVFEHNSTQYIAAYSAGNLFAGSAKGDSVWLFSLDGELEPAPPPNSVMLLTNIAEGEADLINGAEVYSTACLFCHGEEAEGGHGGGPSLQELAVVGAATQIIIEGRNEMPPFGASLTPEQIRDVVAYVFEEFNE
jgi:quinohemoprotein ethanol dehydrogenase